MSLITIHQQRMIAAMGETVLDILFKHEQPVAAVPGGSSFNSIISVGRTGLPCCFVGYAGKDHVGEKVLAFLTANGVATDCFQLREEEKSAISLAFLDERGDAHYTFYKAPPTVAERYDLPRLKADDIMLYGSYYAICKGMRGQVTSLLEVAREADAIIYYDVNFRSSHQAERHSLLPVIESNYGRSTIVRGSADDFDVLYGMRDARAIYEQYVRAHCALFICTDGAGKVVVCTPTASHEYQVPHIDDVVSTVGAGDNFNAGFCYALVKEGIRKQQLATLTAQQWQEVMDVAFRFAGEVCRSTENYVGRDFAATL